MSATDRPSLTAAEWNDRHGYSRPTMAQFEAAKAERERLATAWRGLSDRVEAAEAERDAAVAALGRVRALIPHWTDEIHDGHGAYRAGLAKAVTALERALDGA